MRGIITIAGYGTATVAAWSLACGMVVATCGAADVQPPSRPLNLTLTAKTATSTSLAWDVSTDDSGVAG